MKNECKDDHALQLNMQLMQLLKESLKKKNHAYQDLILDFCDTSAALGPNQWTNYDILTFILGSEAWRNKTKEMILRRSNE